MARRKVLIEDISKLLGIHRNSVSYKLNRGSFYIDEGEAIQETFFPDKELKYLFQKEGTVPAEEKEVV
ncbi:MAG: XRE family transcriptional regulator [Candidatus Dojkabacteria bacterium]|nr:XRE family transcriptional regulator [Candidatus Dojkabacteria bacterium]